LPEGNNGLAVPCFSVFNASFFYAGYGCLLSVLKQDAIVFLFISVR
jgi:hypothetical protein